MAYQDPNFDKDTYWDRRKKGYRGQIASPGSREARQEGRHLGRMLNKEQMAKLREGLAASERKNK